jgi:hypothetical protein
MAELNFERATGRRWDGKADDEVILRIGTFDLRLRILVGGPKWEERGLERDETRKDWNAAASTIRHTSLE